MTGFYKVIVNIGRQVDIAGPDGCRAKMKGLRWCAPSVALAAEINIVRKLPGPVLSSILRPLRRSGM